MTWKSAGRRMTITMLTAFALLGATAVSVHAAPLRARVSVDVAKHVRAFTVTASATRGATCGLLVRASRKTQSLPFLTANARGRVGWHWSAGPNVQRGTWRFTIRCVHGGHAKSRRVVRHIHGGRRHGTVGESDSFRAIRGRIIVSLKKGKDPKGLGGTDNPFPWHQCTWWAWVKRADVYDAAVSKQVVPAGGSRGRSQGETVYFWDGMMWFQNAQKAGIPTGSTPVAGALASWDAYPGNPYGHVAYVEEVQSTDRIRVSQCDGFSLICGDAWINPNARRGRLLGYVYSGPAGNPGSPTPPDPKPTTLKLTISGSCTTSGGALTGASSGFSPGGTATIHAWYPGGREYTNLVHVSRVRADGSIGWNWPCAGDPEGTYTTEAVDDATGASTGRVSFTIGTQPPPPPPPPPSISAYHGGTYGCGSCHTLDIQVHNFPTGTYTYYCHDNSGPGGSDVVFYQHAVTVTDPNQGVWPGVFCYNSPPYVTYLVMNGVTSNSVQF